MPVLGRQIEKSYGEFLYIPISRYIFMSIVTCGIYQAYWIYKNWEYLKNRDNLNIHPFWRGVFGVFVCHDLFRKIHDDPSLNKFQSAEFNHSALASGWVIVVIIGFIIDRGLSNVNANYLPLFITLIFVVIQTTFFIPVQQYINEVNQKSDRNTDYYPWSAGHFVMIGLVIAMLLLGAMSAISSPAGSSTEIQTTSIQPIKTFSYAVYIPKNYQKFVNTDDKFSIYLPPDWTTKIVDKSDSTTLTDLSKTDNVLQKAIFFYDKNTDTLNSVMYIIGLDYTNSGINAEPSRSYITSFNDGIVFGNNKSLGEMGYTNIVVKSKGDYSYYGDHEAVANVITFTSDKGVMMSQKITTIKAGTKIYIIYYIASDDVYAKQINTVDTIIQTFAPIK